MELSSLQRGFVVAAVRALGEAAEGACLRRWPDQPDVARHARALAGAPDRREAEARRLDQPVPSGLGRIHPSWYEVPPPSANGPARWLERRAYAHLAPMDV